VRRCEAPQCCFPTVEEVVEGSAQSGDGSPVEQPRADGEVRADPVAESADLEERLKLAKRKEDLKVSGEGVELHRDRRDLLIRSVAVLGAWR
jgi:hypothetical protein